MFIANWGDKRKIVCEASIQRCDNCKNVSAFSIITDEKTAGLFFIPVAKWDKKYYLVCHTCSAGTPFVQGKENEAIRMFTELPNHQLGAEIYNKLDNACAEFFKKDKDIGKFVDYALKTLLPKWGYKEKDFKYILSVFGNNLIELTLKNL
jgi:hypothetical protein